MCAHGRAEVIYPDVTIQPGIGTRVTRLCEVLFHTITARIDGLDSINHAADQQSIIPILCHIHLGALLAFHTQRKVREQIKAHEKQQNSA